MMMFGATGELTRHQGSVAASGALCHGKEKNHPAERTLIEPDHSELPGCLIVFLDLHTAGHPEVKKK